MNENRIAKIEEDIVTAYRNLINAMNEDSGTYIYLACIRDEVSGTRDEIDEALRRVSRRDDVDLAGDPAVWRPTAAQRDAGLTIGGTERNMIAIH